MSKGTIPKDSSATRTPPEDVNDAAAAALKQHQVPPKLLPHPLTVGRMMGWRKGRSRSGQHLPAQEERTCDNGYFGLEKAFKGLAVSGDTFSQMRLLRDPPNLMLNVFRDGGTRTSFPSCRKSVDCSCLGLCLCFTQHPETTIFSSPESVGVSL